MDLPNDMIHAWLISTDNVIEKSGTPSWSALITALEDIGQGGIALSIKKGSYTSLEQIYSITAETDH